MTHTTPPRDPRHYINAAHAEIAAATYLSRSARARIGALMCKLYTRAHQARTALIRKQAFHRALADIREAK